MDADLDALCIAVYCTADDLLPARPVNARRLVTDAEVVTLCVAQAIMGIPSDRRFLAVARRQLGHLFPRRPGQAGYHKRRRALAETIEWLIGVFAAESPGFHDDLLLIDSTPVECARSVETTRRSALADAADSIFWTCKDILTLERHGARTLHNLRVRVAQRLLALAACIALNHRLGRPSRALVDYVA